MYQNSTQSLAWERYSEIEHKFLENYNTPKINVQINHSANNDKRHKLDKCMSCAVYFLYKRLL